jgi:hypothetical protein
VLTRWQPVSAIEQALCVAGNSLIQAADGFSRGFYED